MGEAIGLPRINEVAAYLEKFAPDTQQSIRYLDPEMAKLLDLGTWGGDDNASDNMLRAGLIARANVIGIALEEAIIQSRSDIIVITNRLSRLKKTRFVSLISGALGSSSVVATASTKPLAAVIAGILALISSIAGLAAENLVLGQRNSEDQLRETVSTLARVISEGGVTRKLLKALQATNFDAAEFKTVVADANQLFGELVTARSKVVAIL